MTLDHRKLLATPPAEIPYRYTARDTILHGLGVGLGMDALDKGQIEFVYGDTPKVFPTQSASIGWVDLTRDPRFYDPAWGLDANRIVVGESIVTQIRPLAPEGGGIARMYFAEAVDKGTGKAALIRTRKDLHDEAGTQLATLDTWLFVRGAGGFGGSGDGGPERVTVPARAADFTCPLPTPQTLALIYRLSLGDDNALHADPDHAKRVGFERPILHGIASLSVGVHAVLRTALGYDPTRFKSASARFVAPVFPGDTLSTEVWVEGDAALFRTKAVEREVTVMDGGRVVFRAE
jgi:acyl dehydratase